jgi:hypothetical protein
MHDALRDALRRVEPPAGFAERVIKEVRLKPDTTESVRESAQPALRFRLAVAATLVAATIGGGLWYRADEQRRGEEAKRQVLLSLNIAGSKLRAIELTINHHEEDR